MRLVLVGLLALGLATPVLAQTEPGPAQPSPADEGTTVSPVQIEKPKPVEGVKKDTLKEQGRVVCTREHVVGSNRPQKVCMTVGRRQELKDQADRVLDPGNRTAGTRNDFSSSPQP